MNEISSLEQIKNASHASFKSRDAIKKSKTAGCFYCVEIFPASEIKEWVDDNLTPICPKCGIDSVLGDALGYPLNKKNLEIIRKDRF
jgi:hypothetical protein